MRTNLALRGDNIGTQRAHLTSKTPSFSSDEVLPWYPKTYWTQLTDISADGRYALLTVGHERPLNSKWEQEHRQLRPLHGGTYDVILVDIVTGAHKSISSVNRISRYNAGAKFWPNSNSLLCFTAMIGDQMHPIITDYTGLNKRPVTKSGFSYGIHLCPDGNRMAFHRDYKIVIATLDGHEREISSGHQFNFMPRWSPDGSLLMFLSGRNATECDIAVIDTLSLKTVCRISRERYKGWFSIMDVPDFHDGSSDIPTWSHDGSKIYYSVGKSIKIASAHDGAVHTVIRGAWDVYSPTPSKDGMKLAYGSFRTTTASDDYSRNIFMLHLESGQETQVTKCRRGIAALWPVWA